MRPRGFPIGSGMTGVPAGLTGHRSLLGALYDDLTTSVVAALRAYTVIHYRCAAVRAGCQGRYRSEIVGTPLVSSLLGEFVFRMCHCSII